MSTILATDKVSRMNSAMSMEAGELVNNYRDTLKFENNPLSHVYEVEILCRLWRLDSILNSTNILA